MNYSEKSEVNLSEIFQGIDIQNPLSLLSRAADYFGEKITLACSFSLEDVTLIHMLSEVGQSTRIFAIDTGRLNEETYACAEAIRKRYGVDISWFFPESDAVEDLLRRKGVASYFNSVSNRKECCRVRKVGPLRRALAGYEAWITGLRREQGVTRREIKVVQIDEANSGIVKLNPLAAWSFNDTFAYVRDHDIPYNDLYDKGYYSIGCAPCTRAVSSDENERAGRWWWEEPEAKECGLHIVKD